MVEYDANRVRQSRVSREGSEFELHVKNYLNTVLSEHNPELCVLGEFEVFNDSKLRPLFLIPVEYYAPQWGDVDLVAINVVTHSPIALISCKLSLHGRFSETLFYSVVYKQQIPGLKVAFATPDKGRQSNSTWESEWGTLNRPTKDRALAEHFLDGVYIDNIYCQTKWGFGGQSALGRKIKALSDLSLDLIHWNNQDNNEIR
ncbi:MAG: BsaWI family type II restriction enzyme [Patescibacteria group bacterium]|nr:BsaWI family type II restriction enzyme [Patescibacteria group bacterium]